ncbi:MAG: DegT/DnrJ/EryC1/StrS family aminotransferase [Acidobacteriia bacterium]|nr:DegT/DnrJ/EryC1/StrS family aminotransferase [Terriglobia bacterium]
MKVPFVDLHSQYLALKPQIDAAFQRVVEQSAFILGEEHDAFERAFAAYIGTRHALGVSSGTDALELALLACGIGPGDEVITVPHTFIATCEAITRTGATIRWVDVDPSTYNMDPHLIEPALTAKTKAVLVVHLYGQPADMDSISKICRSRRLKIVEDCCQSHGARFHGQRVGTFGDVACFSFYPGKNLGAYGDGGAVVTNDQAIADRVRLLRNHGQRDKYTHLVEGYCHRLDNLQAAVLGVKLPHLDEWNHQRRQHAALYDKLLNGIPGVITPRLHPHSEPVYHLYVVQVPQRDRVQDVLKQAGIATGIHYPIPLHEQPAYQHLGHPNEDFPVSHDLGPRVLSLPMFPELTSTQIEFVVENLKTSIRS